MSSGEENGNRIYIYKNDPKVVKKGVNITDVRYPQGGYLPLLTDTPYNERKFDNTSYKYDDRFHHGSRPMHRSTFTLSHVQSSNDINRPISSSYDTQNNYTYRGYQLKPEYIQHRSGDQFKQHFNISGESPMRSLQSSYSADFYKKNNEKEYVSNFDIMPKYSIGKQIYQLEKEGKPRVYPNRGDTIKEALIHNQNEPEFWTQYNRTHGLLAAIRGNGEPIREYPNRTAYNIFTGERLEKPSWTMNGNYRLVSKYRRDLSGNILD